LNQTRYRAEGARLFCPSSGQPEIRERRML
jgi:hypothetical protein